MKRFTISRGYTHVHSIQIDAETYEEAEQKAKNTNTHEWKDCGGSADDMFYQCEGEEDLPTPHPLTLSAYMKHKPLNAKSATIGRKATRLGDRSNITKKRIFTHAVNVALSA